MSQIYYFKASSIILLISSSTFCKSKVEYSLSDTGWSLKPILDSMVEWGNEYREKQK